MVRPSDAPDIDREADRAGAGFWNAGSADGDREVLLDPEAEETVPREEFLRQERPPHYS
ncbi:hypothetical protein NYP18_12235 [Corynebacterium sp. YIM 101645]|uniref:Uncharacterized protein n=1 Tax=Corynebacterium lemuris TaxID=1859292 RepID=A0ABT2FYU4_9CORY|nr:hypothetical protein [Corynebacterium lemuris]